jgi:hypothetical protein
MGEDGKQRKSAIVIGWLGKYNRLALWLVHGCGGNSSNSQPPRSTSQGNPLSHTNIQPTPHRFPPSGAH